MLHHYCSVGADTGGQEGGGHRTPLLLTSLSELQTSFLSTKMRFASQRNTYYNTLYNKTLILQYQLKKPALQMQ